MRGAISFVAPVPECDRTQQLQNNTEGESGWSIWLVRVMEMLDSMPLFGLDTAHMKDIRLNQNRTLKPMYLTAITHECCQ